MRYVRIENKEQAEAIDRLELGVSFQREGPSSSHREVYIKPFKRPGRRLDFDSSMSVIVKQKLWRIVKLGVQTQVRAKSPF